VAHAGPRLKEAAKLGFVRAAVPAARKGEMKGDEPDKAVAIRQVGRIADLVALVAAGKPVRTVERVRAEG
jgi:predicted ATP-dependent serine protease